jgi:RNA polymerase sigma factor (sigma-70 family)
VSVPPRAVRRGSDEELAERAAAGDRGAFAALYERHFAGIHDFAARMLCDRDAAADAVQTTFVKAFEHLRGKPVRVERVKAWLYAIAYRSAVDELRRRKRVAPLAADDVASSLGLALADPSPSADPVAVLRDRELAELVWSAAASLRPDEYALLDLHVRRELGADELAAALDVGKGALYTRLTRVRDSFEQALAALVLARRGRRDCPELDELVGRAGPAEQAELSLELRRAIDTHARVCERCRETRKRLVAPAQLLGGLAPVPAFPGVKEAIWQDVERGLDGGPSGPAAGPRRPPYRSWWAAVAGALALATAAGVPAGILLTGGTTEPPRDPRDVQSTSHRVGEPSSEPVVEIQWTPVSHAEGYSVLFSTVPSDLPDEVADLDGTAAGTASQPLAAGDWYFHLRTRGPGGGWTSTVHRGPFRIVARVPDPEPPASASAPTLPPSPPLAPQPAAPPPAEPPDAGPEPGWVEAADAICARTARRLRGLRAPETLAGLADRAARVARAGSRELEALRALEPTGAPRPAALLLRLLARQVAQARQLARAALAGDAAAAEQARRAAMRVGRRTRLVARAAGVGPCGGLPGWPPASPLPAAPSPPPAVPSPPPPAPPQAEAPPPAAPSPPPDAKPEPKPPRPKPPPPPPPPAAPPPEPPPPPPPAPPPEQPPIPPPPPAEPPPSHLPGT